MPCFPTATVIPGRSPTTTKFMKKKYSSQSRSQSMPSTSSTTSSTSRHPHRLKHHRIDPLFSKSSHASVFPQRKVDSTRHVSPFSSFGDDDADATPSLLRYDCDTTYSEGRKKYEKRSPVIESKRASSVKSSSHSPRRGRREEEEEVERERDRDYKNRHVHERDHRAERDRGRSRSRSNSLHRRRADSKDEHDDDDDDRSASRKPSKRRHRHKRERERERSESSSRSSSTVPLKRRRKDRDAPQRSESRSKSRSPKRSSNRVVSTTNPHDIFIPSSSSSFFPSTNYVQKIIARDPKFSYLPIEWWDRTEECREAKVNHVAKVDKLCSSREELVLRTTLWKEDPALETNMFPYQTPEGILHYTLWSKDELTKPQVINFVDQWLNKNFPQVRRWQYDDNLGERSIELFHVHVYIETIPFSFTPEEGKEYLPPHMEE